MTWTQSFLICEKKKNPTPFPHCLNGTSSAADRMHDCNAAAGTASETASSALQSARELGKSRTSQHDQTKQSQKLYLFFKKEEQCYLALLLAWKFQLMWLWSNWPRIHPAVHWPHFEMLPSHTLLTGVVSTSICTVCYSYVREYAPIFQVYHW